MRRVCDRNEVVRSFPGLPEELCEKWVFTGAGVGWESQDECERSMCSVYTADRSSQLSQVCGPIQTASHQYIFNNFMSAKRLREPCLKITCERDQSSQYAMLGDFESWLAGGGGVIYWIILYWQKVTPSLVSVSNFSQFNHFYQWHNPLTIEQFSCKCQRACRIVCVRAVFQNIHSVDETKNKWSDCNEQSGAEGVREDEWCRLFLSLASSGVTLSELDGIIHAEIDEAISAPCHR